MHFAVDADPSSRVVDMYAGPSKDAMAVFPTRTVSLPDGRTAFSFTMLQAPNMPAVENLVMAARAVRVSQPVR